MEHIIAKLLHDFEHGQMTRRQLIQSLALTATAASAAGAAPLAAAGPGFKATTVNHISYRWPTTGGRATSTRPARHEGDAGRRQEPVLPGVRRLVHHPAQRPPRAPPTPLVDHIAITVENFDKKAAKAELERRGLTPREDQESYHVKDPDGFDLQISSKEMKP